MKISTLIYILLLFLFFFSSCQQIKKSYEETLNPKPQQDSSSGSFSTSSSNSTQSIIESIPEVKTFNSLFESSEKLDQIQSELMNLPQFKDKKLMIYQGLYFYDFQGGRIAVQIQDPNIPENIDNYEYSDEKWQDPTPVKITGNINMSELLFPMDKLKFSVAKIVYDTMVEEAKSVEGGEASNHVYFNHMVIAKRASTYWYSSIRGSRKDLYIDFDLEGRVIKRR